MKTVAVAKVIRESKVKLCLKTSWMDPWQIHPSWTIGHDAPEALRGLEVTVLLVLWGPVEGRNTQFPISSFNIHHYLL